MKRKSTFLRMFALLALMLPWTLQAQNAKVSEYDYSIDTLTYSSIVNNGGTAWTAADSAQGYVDVALPFPLQFGENAIASGATLRVRPNGSAEFTSLSGSSLAPLRYSSGYNVRAGASVYVKSSSSVLTVEWRKVTSGTNSYSFQLKIYSTGDIEFCYGPMTLNSSLSVFVGMMSSANDIYRVGGAPTASSWADITRYTTGAATTRTITSTSHPYYDATTGKGSVYTFTQPACVKLNTLTATAQSSSSIKLDWTYNDAGVKYEIKYSTNESFDPETEGDPVNVTTASALTYTVTGLSANTTYYFAVRKYCNANTPSGWMTTSATTDCAPFTAAQLPIFEDFEAYNTGSSATINRCWTKVYGYNGSHTTYPYPSTSYKHSGTKSLYFYNGSTGTNYRTWVAIPYSGAMNNICVNLWAYKTTASYGNLQVGVMSDPNDYSTFELVQDISFVSGSTSTWYNLEAYFDGYTGNGTYIVIMSPSGSYNAMYIDDITISTMPACRRITNLAVDDNLLLTWNGHGGNAYEVKYATADFDPATEGTAIPVSTASYQLTGLESSTVYYVYVRSSCSDSWQKLVFTTPCTAMTLTMNSPYTEDFNSYTSGYATSTTAPTGYPATHTMPLCWSFLNMSSSTGTYPQMFLTSYSSYAVSGKCLFFKSSSTDPAYAILPKFTNNIQSLQISYTYRNESVSAYNGILYLGYMTDPTDETTFVPLQECAQTTTKTLMEYSFTAAGVTGNNYYIAFRYTGGTSNNYYLAIDNIEVSLIPSCAKPVNLTASNITDQAVTLSWTETSSTPATQWQVKIGEPGFVPATSGRSVIVNGTPTTTVAGLTMTTDYEAYVRAICGDGDTSAWSVVCGFSTICLNGGPVAIGNGTSSNSYFPFYSYYKYSLTQQIYTSAEMGDANTFTGVSFQQNGTATPTRTVDIYMGETNKTAFESNTDWISASEMTLVYSGPFPTTGAGWQTVTFTTPFEYSGNGNVVICVDDNTGSYVSGRTHYTHTATSNSCIRIYSDNTNYDVSNPGSYSGTRAATRNNIKFIAPCLVSCNAPQALSATVTGANVELAWNTVNTTTPANAVVVYGDPDFDPYTSGTRVVLPGSSLGTTLTLAEKTNYDAYVYYVCSSTDSSAMTKVSFTTSCTNPCHDTLVLIDAYGDGWNGNHLDMYVDGVLADSYSDETGSYSGPDTTIVVVNMCPGTIVDFVYIAEDGDTYPEENTMTIINHDGEVIVDSYNGASGSAILWEGRACFTPNCHTPNTLVASNITYTTATLDWTETTTPAPTQWVLGYISENDAAATYIAINTKPYTLTGLTPNTNYAFVVQAVCEPGVDSSTWSNTAYFYTGYCQPNPSSVDNQGMINLAFGDALVVNTDTTYGLTYGDFTNLIGDAGQGTNAEVQITYGTGFDYGTVIWVDWNNDLVFDASEVVYAGQSESTNPTTLSANFTIPANAALGDYRMRIAGADMAYDTYLADTTGTVIADPCYSGNYACLFDVTLRVTQAPTCYKPTALTASNVYGKQATLTWTENTPTAATQWQLAYTAYGETTYKYVNTNNYTLTNLIPETDYTNVMVRAICGAGDTSNWSNPISFTTTASCFAPTALTATATANSATLSWTENTIPTAATRWQVAYGTPGFDPDDPNEATYVETTNNTAFVLNGLRHSRTYQFYVRSLCGEGDTSYWSNVASATTACGTWVASELPLFEDFDSYTSGLPSCWNHFGNGTGVVYSGNAFSGNYKVRFSDATGNNFVVLPAVNVADTVALLTFYTRPEGYTYASCGTFSVGYFTTDSTFVTLETYAYNDWTANTYEPKEIILDHIPAGSRPAFKHDATATNYYWYLDDVTVKLREKVNTLATTGGTLSICNEVIIPDTTNANYANGINATYVIKPAQAGKMVHLTGSYDLENGYDFLNVYRGAVNANNLVGRYTGKGSIDYVSTSYRWADSGYVTLVFTTDADNAFNYTGFHLLATCECPQPVADTVYPVVEANGTYAWINGQTYTNQSITANAADDVRSVFYAQPNVGGCDSVYYVLDLVLHPTYTLTTDAEICERDTFDFYGQKFYTTGTYNVTLQSQYGADSVGVLNLQRHPAPTSGIYVNNRLVTTIADYCDNADLTLLARSNVTNNVTYLWEDSSTAASRVVNPHESNTYTVVVKETVYGCTSTPASLTVTTVPVPELSISGDSVICFGQSATLTLADANNVDATYRWSTGATTTSITVNPTTTTTYTVTATTSNTSACQVTASFTVTVNPLPVVTATASVGEICRDSIVTLVATEVVGYEYSWNTGATTAIATTPAVSTGAYTVTVTDENGCVNEFNTSTVNVYPSYELNDTLNVCYLNNPYTWGAQQITANGNYDQKFTIAHGCDSLVHLAFTFEQMGVENSNIERCYGTTYSFEGITRVATVDTNLTYTLNVGDVDLNGDTLECPKRYNLAVTVNPVKATTVPYVACDSYTWPVSGLTYTTTGEYPVTLATTKGCDSVVTLNLTVNYQNTGIETVTACDNYVWDLDGVNYTASTNEPTFTLQNQWGCDSIVTLNLTVNYRSYHEDYHCVSDTNFFVWDDGLTYNLNVALSDSIEYVTGTNEFGCNEIALLHLNLNPVSNVLNWTNVTVCDEYVIDTVSINESNCEGSLVTAYLRESGDYQLRTRNSRTGQDELTRIHLTVNTSTYHTVPVTACVPYTWFVEVGRDTNDNPINYEVGTYNPVGNDTIINFEMPEQYSNGCSNNQILRLTAIHPTQAIEYASVCKTGSDSTRLYTTFNGVNINGAAYELGEHTIPLITSTRDVNGCPYDSTLVLTVNQAYEDTVEVTLCEGMFTLDTVSGLYKYTYKDTQFGNNVDFTYDGTFTFDSVYGPINNVTARIENTSINGCDSNINYFGVIYQAVRIDTVTEVACENYRWDLNDITYERTIFDSVKVDGEGTQGCEKWVYLNLTINNAEEHFDTINVCTSYLGPDSVTYRETRTFERVVAGAATNGCDSVYYTTYKVNQTELIHQYVVTNRPYTWHGQTYNQSVENVYYDEPSQGDCGNVYSLHLTIVDSIVICDDALPYNTGINDIVITDGTVNVWNNNDTLGNDTILYYTVNPTYNTTKDTSVCNSFVWDGTTYTETGLCTKQYTSVNGCDSVYNYNLTVRYSTDSTVTVTVCDTYTWTDGNDSTYTESGNYVYTTTNAAGCDSVVTLALTVNKNEGVVENATACVTYTWNRNNQTYTNNSDTAVVADYAVQYKDANNCWGDSTLHLTLNPVLHIFDTIVENGGSYLFNGVFYPAPFDSTIVDSATSVVTGCDSIHSLYLFLPVVQNIITDSVTACGTYEWRDGNTYEWMSYTERMSVGNALFRNVTTNSYVYSYPTDTVFYASGAIDSVFVLYLNLLEATYNDSTITVPLSLGTYTIYGIDSTINYVIDFTEYRDSLTETTIDTVLGLGSVYYCDNYVTFHINLINNYDTVYNTICAEDTAYDWNNETYTVGIPGHTYEFEQVANAGTINELVHRNIVNQLPVNARTIIDTVCNSYTWNDTTYTVSGIDTKHFTANLGCDSAVTLNLTVKYSTYGSESATACDSYPWTNNGTTNTYTATGVYTNSYTNAAGCPSTDTLHLTINNSVVTTIDTAVCNSFAWNANTYTASAVIRDTLAAANTCDSIVVVNLTVNLPTSSLDSMVACNSYLWVATNGDTVNTYTVGGTYTYNYNTAAGCASIDTLVLTMNQSTNIDTTIVACDNYTWKDLTLEASIDTIYTYTNAAGCVSNDTLHVTINTNPGFDTTVVSCGDYLWNVNNRTYTTTGDYPITSKYGDPNGCSGSYVLHLTVNANSSYDSMLYISEGSYRYNNVLYAAPFDTTFVEHYTNAVNCDSTLNIHLHVGMAYFATENVINCNDYTWRDGNTYVWITPQERADSNALYFNSTTQRYVHYNPTYTVHIDGDYDSIYMLALTLTQSASSTDAVTLPISLVSVTYGDSTFNFNAEAAQLQDFVNTTVTREVHIYNPLYCDSVVDLTINLVNNYNLVDTAHICVTETSHTWRGHTISTDTNDYDNVHTYYVYDTVGTGNETVVDYRTVIQHPIAYATERRTACDTYTWNGRTFTESTNRVTFDTVNAYGCDSVVTLVLTINHSSSTVSTLTKCDSYTWIAANGDTVDTYTQGGDFWYDYTSVEGCPSTDTLHLTVNYKTNNAFTETVCDSYTWNNNGTSNDYTATGVYTNGYTNEAGCPSVDTLHLTVKTKSTKTVAITSCDSYTWTDGDGNTYDATGSYNDTLTAANGCDSIVTLNLTINVNSSEAYTVEACNSYTWLTGDSATYTTSGNYTYAYSDGNGCASVDTLKLTVNYSTFNDTTVVACQTYTWNNNDYNGSGVYTYAYTNAAGCASVDTLHLTLGSGRTFGTETVTNCGPYTWIVNDSVVGVISESIETSTSFFNARTGCDSVVFLYLTINEQPVVEESATICDSELPYTWNDKVFIAAGEDTIHAPFSAQCDSIYHFTLTVNESKATTLTDQICFGKDYTANGFNIAANELAAAGEYTFVDSLTTIGGCDSVVTLTLTVGDVLNNPVEATACDSYVWNAGDGETYNFTETGSYSSAAYLNNQGCSTIDVLTLTINSNSSRGYTQTVCDSYMWNGTTYDSTGVYTYDYTDGNGCASTDTLTLTVNNSVINTIEVTACDSYEWTDGDGETYTTTGSHTYNYTTTDGCNGTDILVLTINTNSSTAYDVIACDSYVWANGNGETFTTTGDYTYDYTDANGCASTDTLHLTVNNNSNSVYTVTACDSYNWNGADYDATGDYVYEYTNDKGCASIDTLHLTVNYNTNSGETKTACDSYTWNGTIYTQSGTYYSHYNTDEGCASVDTLFLTVNATATTTMTETACESYSWNVETYTQSGTYTQTFYGANGCDSIVTLNLTVNFGNNNAETTTACDSYTWNGTAYTTSGDYTFNYNADNGCASTDTLHLTINSSATGTATAEACNFYVWNGTAYTQSGTYTQTLEAANGCDSVVTLTLTINTQVTNSIAATACGSYTWNGSSYTTSGDYTQTFTSAAGCDSVVTLTLTIAPAITTPISATACESYTWDGTTYATSGVYTNTYTAVNGCDSIVTLSLTINQPVTSTVNATACDSYTWNGTNYTTSGTYTSTATAANGCDSVATLVLTINQAAATSFNATACDSYTWNGASYTATGSYTQNFTTVNGCDSVVTLNLTITPAITTTVNATECSGYTWNGTTYTTSGIYTHTYTSAAGCDSTVTLILTITPAINMTVPTTACDSYTWNGTTYTTSGNYTHTYTAVGGCDSVVTLALTINSSTTGTDNATACDSYNWNGTTYTTSGNYTQTYTAANGCDSVVTMTLTINNSVNSTDEQTACVSYTWNGIVYGATGSYTQTLDAANGCDSVVTLVLTINDPVYVTDVVEECDSYIWIDGMNYTDNTNLPTVTLTAANGCDSVITLNLTINHSVEIYDTILVLETQLPYDYQGNSITAEGDYVFNGTTVNGCDSSVYLHVDVQTVGINVVNSLENVTVYPNPTHGRVTVSAEDVVKVEVLDIVGRLVATFENTNTFDISNLGEGAYTLRITLPDGTTVRKVVKK